MDRLKILTNQQEGTTRNVIAFSFAIGLLHPSMLLGWQKITIIHRCSIEDSKAIV